jgi:hypothetical protein
MPVHDWTRVSDGAFHDFHMSWVLEIKRALGRGLLPPNYYVMAEQRAGDLGGPDVLTLQTAGTPGPVGATALADAPPAVEHRARIPADSYAGRRRTLVVRHASDDRIVALIEVVSRGNKSSRYALQSMLEKVIAALRSGIHVLLIDVHPPGPRDPSGLHGALLGELTGLEYQPPPGRPLTAASYAAGDGVEAFVQPFAVGDPVPAMPLFLSPEFYVTLPLEPCYLAAFEDVPPRYRQELGAP